MQQFLLRLAPVHRHHPPHDSNNKTSAGQTAVGVPGVPPDSQRVPRFACGRPCSRGAAEQVQRQRTNDAAVGEAPRTGFQS